MKCTEKVRRCETQDYHQFLSVSSQMRVELTVIPKIMVKNNHSMNRQHSSGLQSASLKTAAVLLYSNVATDHVVPTYLPGISSTI